jgi:PAS domain S-box-containing protein
MNEKDQFPAIQFFPSPVFLIKNDRSLVTMNPFAIELLSDIKEAPSAETYGFDPCLSFMAQEIDRFFQSITVENDVTIRILTDKGSRYFQVKMRKKVGYSSAPNYMLIVFTEISTTKKAEDLLHEYHRMITALMSNLPGMAYRCKDNKNWSMEFVSDGCFDLTGFRPENLINNQLATYNDLIHPDDRESVLDKVQTALDMKKQFEITYRILDRDGKLKWVWEKGVGVFDENHQLMSIEGFITDISEKKKVEDMKNELVNTVSHELRTPLTSLKESLSMLNIVGENDPDTRKSIVEIANRNVQRLHRLINGILDFQHIESEQFNFQFTKENPYELIELAVEELLPAIYQKHLQVKKPMLMNLPLIWVDRDRIIQVLDNLLENAVKYSEIGTITVRAFLKEKDVVFEVEDEGLGIAESDIPRLFTSFSRLNNQTYKQRGSGLGLAICKKIVEGHQGKIWVESGPGKGSRFLFSIPIRESNPYSRTYSG